MQRLMVVGLENEYQIFMTNLVTKNGQVWVGGESNKGGDNKELKRPSLLYLDKQIGKLVPFTHPMAYSRRGKWCCMGRY